MALIVEFICELPNGVHARPASHVETLCNTFSSQIEWHNLRTDRKGNAKSALALIGTDTLAGDNCQLLISGADEQEAHQRLSQWLRDEFPHCDAPLAEVKSDELEPLPVSLTNLNPQIIRARTVCSGSAGGILTPISSLDLNALGNLPAAKGVDAEQSALENGLTLVLKNIEFRLLDSDGATSAILEAHPIPGWRYFPARTFTGRRQRRIKLRRSNCCQRESLLRRVFPFQQQLPARTCPGRTRRLLPVTPANLR
ncbi:multiphosphoryl transfer protein 2 [includes phosphoenolpyruvate-protein phosphotransferase);phosphocarrier protein Hpr; fructose-like specific PTS system EIIA component] [Escherichia coli]|uniref:Multiphosphoryl transfer protein 2 [includes phosphoenolpyruvate-protein phosphotransferasephosphocarrier protein Hpr fructose-like specific PTS system EIIA component] n=1 Tax=Escherichia coli TaxID=562 RepID=A0A2X1N4S7_ECOLX|nr:multiphosphoryl transfer protein 2 [includes phosphoenolpyruvate-protein phosphotransferase);phosphocarrier protein Hpr; fructose-like specific PTS system EIIA component] [Escherichia coli]